MPDHQQEWTGEASAARTGGAATLAKGVAVLGLIANTHTPLKFADLQRRSGLPKATLHRLLVTLQDEGLIRCHDGDRTYRLGMRLFEMAHHVWENFDLRGNAIGAMTTLRDAAGETVSLGMLDGSAVVYIDELAGSHAVRTGMRVARRDPAYCTAIGKAILSATAPDDRDAYLDAVALAPFTDRTLTDPGALIAQLYLASARGYAIEDGEHVAGVSGIAAPIIDHRGQPVAAIGLSGPSSRLTMRALHALGPAIIDACRRVSLDAGGSPRRVSTVPRPTRAPVDAGVRAAVAGDASLGEAPVWNARTQRLYWVDLVAPTLHVSDPFSGEDKILPLPEIVGGVGLAQDDKLVLAGLSGFSIFDPDRGSAVAHRPSPESHIRSNRFNGGRCDPRGRFWTGTTDFLDVHGRGSLYRLSPDGSCRKMLGGISRLNGPAWSPDGGTMYITDVLAGKIFAFDFHLDGGEIGNRRVFASFPEDGPELPDGLAVDADGFVWCAVWDGWRLHRYALDGTLAGSVILPVSRPTNLAFGGPDLRTLFITTARIRIADAILAETPLAGRVRALEAPTPGLPEPALAWASWS